VQTEFSNFIIACLVAEEIWIS